MTAWQRWKARHPERARAMARANSKRWRRKHPKKQREVNARYRLELKRRVLRGEHLWVRGGPAYRR